MKNTTTKQPTTKAPRTIAVSVIFPWILVIVLASTFAGVVTGWNWRSTAVTEIERNIALSSKEQAR